MKEKFDGLKTFIGIGVLAGLGVGGVDFSSMSPETWGQLIGIAAAAILGIYGRVDVEKRFKGIIESSKVKPKRKYTRKAKKENA